MIHQEAGRCAWCGVPLRGTVVSQSPDPTVVCPSCRDCCGTNARVHVKPVRYNEIRWFPAVGQQQRMHP